MNDAKQLASVLELEDSLHKVLGNLADDGLYVCRTVCRHWHAICKRLPVKLHRIDSHRLEEFYEKFPKAVAISLSDKTQKNLTKATIDVLGSFGSLRDLRLCIPEGRAPLWSKDPALTPLGRLTSFTLHGSIRSISPVLFDSLRHLVNLAFLEIDLPDLMESDMAPFNELKLIEDLRISSALAWNRDGQCMFPSAPHLTRLDLKLGRINQEDSMKKAFEAACFYRSTLVSFGLCSTDGSVSKRDWSMLKACSRLESLRLMHALPRNDMAFLETLEAFTGLTELVFSSEINPRDPPVLTSVFSLSKLQSLEIHNAAKSGSRYGSSNVFGNLCDIRQLGFSTGTSPFSQGQHLTKLVTSEICFDSEIRCLKKLEHLDIQLKTAFPPSLVNSIGFFLKLKELRLGVVEGSDFQKGVFSNLTELTTLKMHLKGRVFDHLLPSIAVLASLKCFSYDHELQKGAFPACVYQFSLLSSLTSLEIGFNVGSSAIKIFPEGSFQCLRRLHIVDLEMSTEDRRELTRKLPSLIDGPQSYRQDTSKAA